MITIMIMMIDNTKDQTMTNLDSDACGSDGDALGGHRLLLGPVQRHLHLSTTHHGSVRGVSFSPTPRKAFPPSPSSSKNNSIVQQCALRLYTL